MGKGQVISGDIVSFILFVSMFYNLMRRPGLGVTRKFFDLHGRYAYYTVRLPRSNRRYEVRFNFYWNKVSKWKGKEL